MPKSRLLTEEQLKKLLATKNKQERIKLAIEFNLGTKTVLNLYQYYKNKDSRRVKDLAKEPDFKPLQMIMMPNLQANEIIVNGAKIQFPQNKAVIQGVEFAW